MRFSLLLPTRNRLDLLRQAIFTIIHQDFDDWELVVSDNASHEDVKGYVDSLSDRRIVYLRSDDTLPVTENWNRALAASHGEYVLMLGDDDGLMRGALRRLDVVATDKSDPDFFFLGAFQFTYPGVLPRWPNGYLSWGGSALPTGDGRPYLLDPARARGIVQRAMKFELPIPYNAQHFLVHRRMIDRLRPKGAFYQSPYPDYYAALALFLTGESIAVCQEPWVAIGISPKSFGFYYFNRRESAGTVFLKNVKDEGMLRSLREVLLPGSDMNTSWLFALETVRRNFREEANLQPLYAEYRRIQLMDAFVGAFVFPSPEGKAAFWDVARGMTARELAEYGPRIVMRQLPRKWMPERIKPFLRVIRGRRYSEFAWARYDLRSMQEVFERVEPAAVATELRSQKN